jgi:hypothetical protein
MFSAHPTLNSVVSTITGPYHLDDMRQWCHSNKQSRPTLPWRRKTSRSDSLVNSSFD